MFTHLSLAVDDLGKAVWFYEDVLGMRRIETPDFKEQADFNPDERDIAFMQCDEQQLHLFKASDECYPLYTHFAVHVKDFCQVYKLAVENDLFAGVGQQTAPARVFQIEQNAQMYLRDPSGHLVEIDYPDIRELDKSMFAEVIERDSSGPKTGVYTKSLLERITH